MEEEESAAVLIEPGRAWAATAARGAAAARRASMAGRAATEAREEASISCGDGEARKWRRKTKWRVRVRVRKSEYFFFSRSEHSSSSSFSISLCRPSKNRKEGWKTEMRAVAAVSLPRPGPGRLLREQVREN